MSLIPTDPQQQQQQQQQQQSGEIKCAKCGVKVDKNDKYQIAFNEAFHDQCLACTVCQMSLLDSNRFISESQELLCETHYFERCSPSCMVCCKEILRSDLICVKPNRVCFHLACLYCVECNRRVPGNGVIELIRIWDSTSTEQRLVLCEEHCKPYQNALNYGKRAIGFSFDSWKPQIPYSLKNAKLFDVACQGLSESPVVMAEPGENGPENCLNKTQNKSLPNHPFNQLISPNNRAIIEQPPFLAPRLFRSPGFARISQMQCGYNLNSISGERMQSMPMSSIPEHVYQPQLPPRISDRVIDLKRLNIQAGAVNALNRRSRSNHELKFRRSRTSLTAEQGKMLREHFAINQVPKRDAVMKLANDLGLDPRVVKVWFQNRRAIVRKREGTTSSRGAHNRFVIKSERAIVDDDTNKCATTAAAAAAVILPNPTQLDYSIKQKCDSPSSEQLSIDVDGIDEEEDLCDQ